MSDPVGLSADPAPVGAVSADSGRPTWGQAVRGAATVLAEAGVTSSTVDARLLAEHLVGPSALIAAQPTEEQLTRYAALIEQRRLRVPLQHLTGEMSFRYLTLEASPGAFIARPETEVVAGAAVEAVLGFPHPVVIDLCTGSGAIALAIATEVPDSQVYAVELSAEAIAVAARNIKRHTAPGGRAPVRLIAGDATADLPELAALRGQADVVVSNPPYIPPDQEPVDPEVREHDPEMALYGGGVDGLAIPRGVIAQAAVLLRPGGVLIMEHAEVQAQAARDIAAESGYTGLTTGRDLTGRDRYLRAVRP